MTEALLVNPHSAAELSDAPAIRKALAMTLNERKRRWRSLMEGVQQQDVTWWMERFTHELATAPGGSSDTSLSAAYVQAEAPITK